RFHSEIDSHIQHGQSPEREKMSQCRYRSEHHDRNFVRRALRRGVPVEDIENRLLTATEFHRLNPEPDPVAYVRGLIDEEGSSLRSTALTEASAPSASARHNNSLHPDTNKEHTPDFEVMARRYIQE